MSRLKDTDDFGNRMKAYETVETARRLDPMLPIYARIDGRAFSTFTRGMERPFDMRMTAAMIETTKYLVHATHARIGYVQSDEISLAWAADDLESDVFFSGKVQKMCSVLASMAAAKFATVIPAEFAGRLPHFDARVFQLPSREEAANAFLWRAMDARKNAISMVAQSRFSHSALHGKDQKAMLAMLAEAGVDFEGFPISFRRGTFVRHVAVERLLTAEEMERIPEKHRPIGPVMRSEMQMVDMPPFNKVTNRAAVIFDGAEPLLSSYVLRGGSGILARIQNLQRVRSGSLSEPSAHAVPSQTVSPSLIQICDPSAGSVLISCHSPTAPILRFLSCVWTPRAQGP